MTMYKVLLIAEDIDELTVLGNMISSAFPGADISSSLTGSMGIQMAIDKDPDVILLNMCLPDMDGLEVCRQLKNDSRVKDLPVVLLIKNQDTAWKLTALDAGADGFLAYPVDSAELTAQIKAMSRIKQNKLSIDDKYHRIFENVQDVYYECTLDGVILEISPSIVLITKEKYSKEEFIGRTIRDLFINIKERDFLRNSLFEKGSISDYEITVQLKDGEIIPCTVSSKIWLDEHGTPQKIIGSLRDITYRKQSEELLKKSEESYRFMFEDNPQPMLIYDRESLYFVKVNNAAVQFYGYSEEEFLSMTVFDIRPADDFVKFMEHNSNNNPSYHASGEWRHIKRSGEIINVTIVSHALIFNNRPARHVLVNDVTERITIEHDLRVSEARFRKMVECSPNGVVIYQNGKFVYINPAGLRLFGVDNQDKLIGKEVISLVHPQSVDSIASTMELVAQGQTFMPVEEKLIRMDGTPFYAELTVFATTNNNNPAGQIIIRNITARKEAEESAHSLSLAINQSQEIVFITNKEGIITFINSQFTTVYGYTEEEIIGKQTPRILKSNMFTHQQYRHLWNSLLMRNRKYAEYVNKCKDGRLIEVEGSADPILDKNGDITGFLGIQRVISERKKAEQEIAHSHELMRYVIEHNWNAIAIHDKDLRYIYVSQRYLEDYHVEGNIIGRHHYEVFPELPQKWRDIHQKALAGEVISCTEDHCIREDGKVDWARWECRPWYSADGAVGGIIVYTEVINKAKKAEADLIAAKVKAEESDRLKSAFLANMSHEIRTPLNSIVGFSELLRDSYYEDYQRTEFIELIIKNGQNLLAIINDILDLSKIQAGELKIKKKELLVNSYLKDTVKEYDMKFQHTSVKFQFIPPDNGKDVAVLCDPERLSQVFNNLLSNAGKFTKQGSVKLSYLVKDGIVEFNVKDTGIGIAPEYHEKIFDRFRQIEGAHSRKFGGNGLGLAISKKLIELMDGTIWVKSKQGEGAAFYFTLPLSGDQQV